MKKRMAMKKAIAIFAPCMTFLVALMIVIAILVSMFAKDISLWLYGRKQNVDTAALANGTELCENIVEEGIVLLKNEKDDSGRAALPLSKEEIARVNVFGWAAYDWMTSAFGSGYSNTALSKLKLFPALEEAGIEYNEDLFNLYKNFYSRTSVVYGSEDLKEYRNGVSFGSENIFILHEPNAAKYTPQIRESIQSFSDVALVVIGRTGSESKDLKLNQVKQPQTNGSTSTTTTTDRHYLQLSTEEEEMIEVAKETCEKVIVVLNTANTMETGFIDDEGIDGALLVGITGLTGVNGLINVLRGEKEEPVIAYDENGDIVLNEDGSVKYETNPNGTVKTETVKVSPSGRTVDTYAYDILGTMPSTVSQGTEGAAIAYTNGSGRQRAYIDYSEGIYVGYKWYETANAEGYWANVSNDYGAGYEGVVQYPFGYGLSYTDFEWEVTHISKSSGQLAKNDKIEISVKVTNVGDYPAREVVQLYYTPQYNAGEVEKAYVNLADFAKTKVLAAGESDTVTLSVSVQSMASYDCYDKNGNGHTGYELDGGNYQLRLMKNSHEPADMTKSVYEYTVPADGYNYDEDEKTGKTVENRFTNPDGNGNDQAIDEGDLDGSHENGGGVKYLSRADFAGTYPVKTAARAKTTEADRVAKQDAPTQEQLEKTGYDNVGERDRDDNGLKFEDLAGTTDYNASIWADVIANISDKELINLVSDGYFQTAGISSIDKPTFVDLDGPLGFNTRVTGTEPCQFVAYPSGTMLAQTWNTDMAFGMGRSVGKESPSMDGLHGWYAPGGNIHRSPFGGRNGEYYSEDPILAGKICAGTVAGAKSEGVYCYVKHFVCNDTELNRDGLFTFLTEQTLRETYLRPFEIMIKEGGGNALMTSMNRLGRVWSGGNYGLMTQIVRNEWGFQGTAVTDWVDLSGTSGYMPAYRGIWAGNDIWLTNGAKNADGTKTLPGINSSTALKIAENVAHDVLWTAIDTQNAASAEVDFSSGAEYNMDWIAGVVVLEVAILAGVGVMAFFMTRSILAHVKGNNVAEESVAEGSDGEPTESDVAEKTSDAPTDSDSKEE